MSKAEIFSSIGSKIANIGEKFKKFKENIPSKDEFHKHIDTLKKNVMAKAHDHREGIIGAGATTGAYHIGSNNGYEDGRVDGFKEAAGHLLRQAMMKENVENSDFYINEIKQSVNCGLASVFNKKIK